METALGIVLAAVIGALIAYVVVSRARNTGAVGAGEGLTLLQQQMGDLSRAQQRLGEMLSEKFAENERHLSESVHAQLKSSSDIVRDVTERLTRLDETNKQVISFADQLKNLQDILKNPKQRGILGEYYLETLLKNVLPVGGYQMQYPFSDGTIVDAVVFVRDRIIPIDSKFSLENYNRLVEATDAKEREQLERSFKQDLKNRIDETAKYVKPSENTMDFAFMFIPHEAIYYDLLVAQVGSVKVNTRDLVEYAFKEKHVIIVSPTSFLAYLQTVLQGLKALQIEESAKEIRKRVEELGKHINAYDEYLRKLGVSLGTSVSHYNTAYREFKKMDKDVYRIADVGGEITVLSLEKPTSEHDE